MDIKKKSIKNYVILAFIMLISVFLVIYFYMWYNTYESENVSIIGDYLNVIHYNELDSYLIENKDTIIYVNASNTDMVRSFEKRFKRLIEKNALNNKILYLNIAEELNNNKMRNEIVDKYGVNVPYILIFEDGSVKSKFVVKDNRYDVSQLIQFFVNEGVIDD